MSKVGIGIVGSRFQADCIAASVRAMPEESFEEQASLRDIHVFLVVDDPESRELMKTVLEYAGDGKWRTEEDFWALPAARRAQTQYEELCAKHDPDHPSRMTRANWPVTPEWARGPAHGPGAA